MNQCRSALRGFSEVSTSENTGASNRAKARDLESEMNLNSK